MGSKSFIFSFGDVEVREREFTMLKAGVAQAVEPKAFRVLLVLLKSPQKLVAKEELMKAVWGDAAVTDNSLTRSIALLRKVLGDDVHQPRYIETVTTVGYRFLLPVEIKEDASAGTEAVPIGAAVIKDTGRGGTWGWWVGAAAMAAAGLAVGGVWLSRPLPPPRVTGYVQITHDGAQKDVSGTDGSRVYFTFGGNATNPIGEVAASGGEIAHIPIAMLNVAYLEDISTDGTNFLFVSNEKGSVLARPHWNVHMPGVSPRRLPDAMAAAFSPDGRTVVYSTPEGDLWLVGSDGSTPHKLAAAGGQVFSLAWSPSGEIIRFTKIDGVRLWEISANGTNLHELLPGWKTTIRQCCGRWTSDGKLFLFLTISAGYSGLAEIWALDERRALLRRPQNEPVQLTSGPIGWGPLAPSKDGKKIFSSGQSSRGELSRFDAKAGRFEPYLGGISARGVSFSKDGRFVAYVSYPEGTLWKADRDGSHPMQLTEAPIEAVLPRWSPDGGQIVFSNSGSYPPEAYVVSADGSGLRRILPEDKELQVDPAWSPDGRTIVFSSANAFGNAKGEIRMLEPGSRKVTSLPGSVGIFSPRYSPDGRFIAAISIDQLSLKMFDTRTQKWTIFPQKDPIAFPEWSKDSRSVYFIRINRAGDSGIFRIPVTGAEPELVASLKGIKTAGWDGWWMGLDDSDAPLVLKDIGTQDVYALALEEK